MVGVAPKGLIVRTTGDPLALAPRIRAEIRQMDPALPIFDVQTMVQVVEGEIGFQRGITSVIGGFGALALLLAVLGLYGVIAFTVIGRTREIGVRIALGADRGVVVRVFLRDGMRLTLIGLAVGGMLAVGVGRLVSSIAVGVRPADPVVFVGVGLVLALAALLSTYLPARRATRVDPMIALQAE